MLLLSAFGAGVILTQFVPAYEEMASSPAQQTTSATAHETAHASVDVPRIDG
jgi:hypothetical protein